MKLIFACGGTAGHINPAIAVANYIKERHKDAEILFIGNPNGMENKLVPEAGFQFAPVEIMGFQRSMSLNNIKRNIKSATLLLACDSKIKKILKDFEPDLVMGTGGYVSGPVLKAAHDLKIKTVCHEQNAFPGVANKLAAKFVDKVLLAVPEAEKYIQGRECIVTGNPVREEIIFKSREKSREALGITSEDICLVSFGGSLGAKRVNEAVERLVEWNYDKAIFHHIHATGRYGTEMCGELKERGFDVALKSHIDLREYISNMDECLAAADLVICRAGAITLSELEVAGRASILIPSPNVAENHQFHNAMVLKNADAAVLIEEKDLSGDSLIKAVEALISDKARLKTLGENARKIAIIDANERIYNELMGLLRD